MTLEERAEHIAKRVIAPHCAPYYVAGTSVQQDAVIADMAAQLVAELKDFAATLCPKPPE